MKYFNWNIQTFIEDFGLISWKQKYLSYNVIVLTADIGDKIYLISEYNTIFVIAKGVKECYELDRVLVGGSYRFTWIPRSIVKKNN